MRIIIPPIKGIKEIKIHQPLFPVSCSLLTVTERLGINIIREKRVVRIPMSSVISHPKIISIIVKMIEMRNVNKINIQYSLRLDLPLKLNDSLTTLINAFMLFSPPLYTSIYYINNKNPFSAGENMDFIEN
jgi:hypothetical protein